MTNQPNEVYNPLAKRNLGSNVADAFLGRQARRLGGRGWNGGDRGGGLEELNRRAIATLERLASRYESKREIPGLNEVEAALWHAGKLADRRLGGYWPSGKGLVLSSNIERWTSNNLGWSFPCAEAVGLIRRYFDWPSGRIIDVGAGCGLWTRVLMREFGVERVIGLDPMPKDERVIKTSSRIGGRKQEVQETLMWCWHPGCRAMANREIVSDRKFSIAFSRSRRLSMSVQGRMGRLERKSFTTV